MSADASASSFVPAQAPAREPIVAPEPVAEAPGAVYWHGNPAALGLPCFIAGSVALGLAYDHAPGAAAALQAISDAADASLILILSDINMPGMSGLELLPKAKEIRPDVPVIMITAYGDAETKRKALERGADALQRFRRALREFHRKARGA